MSCSSVAILKDPKMYLSDKEWRPLEAEARESVRGVEMPTEAPRPSEGLYGRAVAPRTIANLVRDLNAKRARWLLGFRVREIGVDEQGRESGPMLAAFILSDQPLEDAGSPASQKAGGRMIVRYLRRDAEKWKVKADAYLVSPGWTLGEVIGAV